MTTDQRTHPVVTSGPPGARPVSPPAVRLQRPGLRDPRLLLGVVLVGLSVALGAWVVGAAARTTPVWVAGDALVPGTVLTADLLEVAEVRLTAPELYVAAEQDLPEGLVVTRTVAAGELVPRSALGAQDAVDLRPVVVPAGALPRGLVPGAVVDLWHLPEESPAAPRLLASGLTVSEVADSGSTFTPGPEATVHVLVPTADLAPVLGALAAGPVEVVLVPEGSTP